MGQRLFKVARYSISTGAVEAVSQRPLQILFSTSLLSKIPFAKGSPVGQATGYFFWFFTLPSIRPA